MNKHVNTRTCLQVDLPIDLIDKSTDCWLWKGPTIEGYGMYKGRRVHRVTLAKSLGRELNGLSLHKCKHKNCCNPAHLYEGTHKENMQDMTKDQTHDGFNRRGQKHPLSKLTDEQTAYISNSKERTTVLANRFNVTPGAIVRIRGAMPYKLTSDDIQHIRDSCDTCKNLSERYGVSASTISNIKRGVYVRHTSR